MRRLSLTAFAALLAGSACSRRAPAPGAGEGSDAGAAAASSAEVTLADAGAAAAGSRGSAGVPPPGASAAPLNVLLISVDSLRADMPWAGYPRAIAPRLSALHARSVSYANAYATSSFTSKSVAGLLTSRYPSELARTGSFFTFYQSPGDFFCKALDREGVPCVAGHAHAYFGKRISGFEHGFRRWELVPDIPFDYETDPYVTSDKLTPLAIAMLTEVAGGVDGGASGGAGRPFFAWFHYMDPHDKYLPHDESPKFGKRARDLYDEEVFFTDLWIGKLLDFVEAQPWAARTAIVVTADHGEAFGEHNLTRHAHEVYEELVRVPLFVRLPGAAPRKIDAPRSHVDLAPTFVELLGAAPLAKAQGASLVAELRGGDAPARDVIVDLPQDEYNERRRALIHERLKLIAFGDDVRFALYDLDADPKESDDIFWKRRDVAEDMRKRYKDASRRIADRPPTDGLPRRDR